MKEVLNSEILKIEDRELRSLIKYEQIIAWHKSGGVQRAITEYRSKIAAADQAKAVAELRVAQINVINATVSRFDGRVIRNDQKVAAQHRSDAAERLAIQEAIDEVLALEEIVPADDIDDILAQVSCALGIELPTEADKVDICQRGPKSMADLKRELGPSLVTYISDPSQATKNVLSGYRQAFELISDVRLAATRQGLISDTTSERYSNSEAAADAAHNRLTHFIYDLIDRVHFPLYSEVWVEPERGRVDPVQEVKALAAASNLGSPQREAVISVDNKPFVSFHDWAEKNIGILDDESLAWIDKYAPAEADDVLDGATLDTAWKAANDGFDVGMTLEQLGWSRPAGEPPDRPHGVTSLAEVIRRAAA